MKRLPLYAICAALVIWGGVFYALARTDDHWPDW